MSLILKRLSVLFGALILALVGVLLFLHFSQRQTIVGEIRALQPGPYAPEQSIILGIQVQSRSGATYKWSNEGGGGFSGPTNDSNAEFVAPKDGPARVICDVMADGATYSRTFPVTIKSTASSVDSTTVFGQSEPTASTSTAVPGGEVLSGIRFAKGLFLGVDTSSQRRDWVSINESKDAMRLAYPGDPIYGAIFITVGKPRDKDRPGIDYSGFKILAVELKGEHGGETLDVGVKDWKQPDDGSETKKTVTLSSSWQTYRFSIREFKDADLTHLYVLCELVFDDRPETVYVRRIQYTK